MGWRLIAAALLLLYGFCAQAQMYKCVDAKGVTHYSDKPQPGCKSAEVDIRSQPPVSGQTAPRQEDFKAAERDFQRRQIQRGREEDAAAGRAELQKRRCATLHARLDMLTRFNIISKMNEKGERVYMDDATRDAQIAQLRTEIAQQCR